ncbi:MFS general substrate transporter [Serendipita vermifera]|nr:MFS general substrate transporter [Serendipita vermifera]
MIGTCPESQYIKDRHGESKKSPAMDPAVTVTGTVEETTTVPILADGNDGRHNEEKSEERDVEKAIEESQSSSPAALEIPDGGRTAWLTVFGAWCILFSTFGMTNAYGVYQDFYVRHFLTNETPSAIGWVGSVQLFFQFSMGAITGKLFDAGHFYTIMIPGSLLYVFCYFMLSLTKPGHYYQVFLTQGLGAGIGLGLLFLPAMGVISHHFKNRRGLAMGIAVSGSSIGGLVFPVMLNKLIEQKGFPWATRAAAFLCTGVMTIAILCMKTRPPPKTKTPQGTKPPLPSIKDLIIDSKYTIATIGSFFNMLGLFTPIFYLQLYAVTHGVDPNLAFYTISILMEPL